jgi:hypothetical protein
MFQAMYQCHRGIANNHLTSRFLNLYILDFEGAFNVESFVTPPYTLIQHVGKCKSHQALPIIELRSLQDRYPLSQECFHNNGYIEPPHGQCHCTLEKKFF